MSRTHLSFAFGASTHQRMLARLARRTLDPYQGGGGSVIRERNITHGHADDAPAMTGTQLPPHTGNRVCGSAHRRRQKDGDAEEKKLSKD